MDRNQWAIYKETGRYAQPFFVIQGDRGGHKRNYTEIEAKISIFYGGQRRAAGCSARCHMPSPTRARGRSWQLDLARFWTHALALYDRKPDLFDARGGSDEGLSPHALGLDGREGVRGVLRRRDMNAWRGAAQMCPLPVGFKDNRDYEAEHRSFIEDGT
jgi:hypothetical protein